MRPTNLKKINEAFTLQAPAFESSTYHLSKQEYLDYTVRKTNPVSTDTILEVAAGTCVCGRSLARHAGHVVCLDATPAMLEVGRSEAEKDDMSNITFVKGYAEELPFLDDCFDIVISRLAFHHFVDVNAAFSEMVRVLKPGGKLVMIDMVAMDKSLREKVDYIEGLRDPSHVRNLTLNEMSELYVNSGLALITQEIIEIPVSLESWMDLTHTSETVRTEIRHYMEQELEGIRQAGFSPYWYHGNIYFHHHWVYNLAIK